MEIAKMSLSELRRLNEEIESQLKRHEKTARAAAVEQIYAIANSLGLPLKSLLAGAAATRKPRKDATYYQDPANPSNTWIGRGPRPTWLKDALAGGKLLSDFRA